ncbi:MAG: hypothetical protein QW491_10855 [Thermoproteota archaeon]|nr:hypothetical protein [Candidatus Brockarchaeota archaeon]
MSQLKIPIGLRENLKSVVIEYLSEKGLLDRNSYLFFMQLAGIVEERGNRQGGRVEKAERN